MGVALGALLLGSGAAAVAYWRDTSTPAAAEGAVDTGDFLEAPRNPPTPTPTFDPTFDPTPTPTPTPTPSPTPSRNSRTTPAGKNPSKKPSASPQPSDPSTSPPSDRIDIPAKGPGTFRTARIDGARVGEGSKVLRYQVQVEDGIDISARAAGTEVSAILGDRRGWTRDGTRSFQLASSGSYDFVVKIATPGTVDRICGAAGLRTRGEVNCSVGKDVVVNLKRWVLGSPQFDGPIGEYHALIVNHEVGHRIGYGHEGCPGPGKPAPAMMQQIKGLDGCVANAWPYDRDGRYLGGPAVP